MAGSSALFKRKCDALYCHHKMSASNTCENPHYYSEVDVPARVNFERYSMRHQGANSNSAGSSSGKKVSDRKALVVLFAIVVALLLGTVGACIAFSLEISKLKSNAASAETVSSLQRLNASINTQFDARFQELRNSIILLHASCAALPPSSPSGYYWVLSSLGSPVCVYCDMTRSCGGVTGRWMRVAYLHGYDK